MPTKVRAMNTAFSDLEFWLWAINEKLRKKFVAKKSGTVAPLSRTLRRKVRVALYELSLSVDKPVTKFVSLRRRILLAKTASSSEVKGLPAAYRGMLRDTYKLGLQLDQASKRSVRSNAARATIEGLQRKYETLLAAVEG
jgi:hypothetical protein